MRGVLDPMTLTAPVVRMATPPLLDLLWRSRREGAAIVVELLPAKVTVSAVTCRVRVWNPKYRKFHRGGNSILAVRILQTHGDDGSTSPALFRSAQSGVVHPGELVEEEIGWKQNPVVRVAVTYVVVGGAEYTHTFKDPFPGRRGSLRRTDNRALWSRAQRVVRRRAIG